MPIQNKCRLKAKKYPFNWIIYTFQLIRVIKQFTQLIIQSNFKSFYLIGGRKIPCIVSLTSQQCPILSVYVACSNSGEENCLLTGRNLQHNRVQATICQLDWRFEKTAECTKRNKRTDFDVHESKNVIAEEGERLGDSRIISGLIEEGIIARTNVAAIEGKTKREQLK